MAHPHAFERCLDALGYREFEGTLFEKNKLPSSSHPFCSEIIHLLSSKASARAVFCVDELPVVYLLDKVEFSVDNREGETRLHRFLERVWNQNLASVVLACSGEGIEAYALGEGSPAPEKLPLDDLRPDGVWSAASFVSGKIIYEKSGWFDPKRKVDQHLLNNITYLASKLTYRASFLQEGLTGNEARILIARMIFISYLEHRKIVGDEYRKTKGVGKLLDLVAQKDREGLDRLNSVLKADFNGDFLNPINGEKFSWQLVSDDAMSSLEDFLKRTDLSTGQLSLWHYDFSEIPIEMISGIYETFLKTKDEEKNELAGKTKKDLGAYYTPRHLAAFAVNEAFGSCNDPLKEIIYDGACGSGILLTTAYRRLLAIAEDGNGAKLSFEERKELLIKKIYGGDIDHDACRLTSLSLYLALLSGLEPSDLSVLQSQGSCRLPNIIGKNLFQGPVEGDFFASNIEKIKPTIIISNPPWREPTFHEVTSADDWAKNQPVKLPIPRRQIAYAYALRAADLLAPGGKVILILPMTGIVSAGETNRIFRAALLDRYKVERIINFSDVRRLVFGDAIHAFVIFNGAVRDFESEETINFEYVTPKADISLALGRFAVHASEKISLPKNALLSKDPELLMHYWGNAYDINLVKRLWRLGRVEDQKKNGWIFTSGFHLTDGPKRTVSDQWREAKFLDANRMPKEAIFLDPSSLDQFPYQESSKEPQSQISQGPRILFVDGAPNGCVKAIFTEIPFTFRHTIKAVAAPEKDRLLLRFLVVYMHSLLGQYLLTLLSRSIIADRQAFYLDDLKNWPFVRPENHPTPEKASEILKRVDTILEEIESQPLLLQEQHYIYKKKELDTEIYQYFNINTVEQILIEDMARIILPSLQPASLQVNNLITELNKIPNENQINDYREQLALELKEWSGGKQINVSVLKGSSFLAAVELRLAKKTDNANAPPIIDDVNLLKHLAGALRRTVENYPLDRLFLVPNMMIPTMDKIFIVKPLRTRFWMKRQAIEDAERLVAEIQSISLGLQRN